MKPFDLQAAKAGESVVTRNGRKVIDLHHFERDISKLCLCAHIEGDDSPDWFQANGRESPDEDSELDLFMAPKKTTTWVNLYDSPIPHDESVRRAAHFPTKEMAERNAADNNWVVLATAIPIEIEV